MSEPTAIFSIHDEKDEQIREILQQVYAALKEKGYNPVNQLVGYILSEDPTYITTHNGARSLIRKVDRDELLDLLDELRAQLPVEIKRAQELLSARDKFVEDAKRDVERMMRQAELDAKAAELGMTGTTFKNACGLDTEGHLSTARDVAVMSRAILRECPEVLHYSGIWTDTLRGGETMLVNTNKLLRRYEGITGLKTGTTGGAGVCISASASRDGLDLIAVVLGSDSSAERFDSATRLLDYGFANYEAAPLPDLSGRPLYLDVTGSDGLDVPLDYSALPERLLVPRGGASALTASVELPGAVPAPLSRGDEVGTVTIAANGTPVGSWPICAAAGAAPLDFDAAVRLMLESLL